MKMVSGMEAETSAIQDRYSDVLRSIYGARNMLNDFLLTQLSFICRLMNNIYFL